MDGSLNVRLASYGPKVHAAAGMGQLWQEAANLAVLHRLKCKVEGTTLWDTAGGSNQVSRLGCKEVPALPGAEIHDSAWRGGHHRYGRR